MNNTPDKNSLKENTFDVIFGHETPAGKGFDLALIIIILASVFLVIIDSVESVHLKHSALLYQLEWLFTLIFTVEYSVRVWCARNRLRYMTSFYGLVDLLSILPTYLSLIITGTNYLLVIRLLRVLRLARILKLFEYIEDSNMIAEALWRAHRKIFIFLYVVLVITTVFGALMYTIEGPENGFTSIPKAIYWAIVTVTTVGYGDVVPHTVAGQAIATMAMILGYAIIAVPTSIITVEMTRSDFRLDPTRTCDNCGHSGHEKSAVYCKKCGSLLGESSNMAN